MLHLEKVSWFSPKNKVYFFSKIENLKHVFDPSNILDGLRSNFRGMVSWNHKSSLCRFVLGISVFLWNLIPIINQFKVNTIYIHHLTTPFWNNHEKIQGSFSAPPMGMGFGSAPGIGTCDLWPSRSGYCSGLLVPWLAINGCLAKFKNRSNLNCIWEFSLFTNTTTNGNEGHQPRHHHGSHQDQWAQAVHRIPTASDVVTARLSWFKVLR